MNETELKLKVSPTDFAKLRAALPRFAKIVDPPKVKRVVTDYYETPDLALAQSGISLRVRDSGGRYVQGLKARPAAPSGRSIITKRDEREWPIDAMELDFKRLDGELPAHALATLKRLFTTSVRRTETGLKTAGGARVKLVFDEGRILSGRESRPLCEVELELNEGGSESQEPSLYRLALELQRAAPVSIATESKADRGYQLATGTIAAPSKAAPLALPTHVSAVNGFHAVFQNCVDRMLGNQAAALSENKVEGVHQMRVATRRLRSLLKLFRAFLASPEVAWIDGELKWLGRELGRARDWDVFTTHTLQLIEEQAQREAVNRVRGAARRAQRAAHAALRRSLCSPRFTTLALALGAWNEESRWWDQLDASQRLTLGRPLRDLGREFLERTSHKVDKAGDDIDVDDAKARHRLRKTAKKLRYAEHFFLPLYASKRAKRRSRDLSDLQDFLGELNDLATAERLISELAAAGPRTLRGAAHRLKASLRQLGDDRLKKLPALYRRYERKKPFWR